MEAKKENENAATTPIMRLNEYETEEQRQAKQRMAVLGNDHIFAFGEVFETSLTFSISFSIHFAIHVQKHVLHLLTVMDTCHFKGH